MSILLFHLWMALWAQYVPVPFNAGAGGSSPALINSTTCAAAISACSTSPINMTGATFLVIIDSCFFSCSSNSVSDSTSLNTWTSLTIYSNGSGALVQMYYVCSPVVSSSQTFTVGTSIKSTFFVGGFSGAGGTGCFISGTDQGAAGFSPGSATPSAAGNLAIFGIGNSTNTGTTVNIGTIFQQQTTSSSEQTGAIAWYATPSTSAISPVFTVSASPTSASNMAIFK